MHVQPQLVSQPHLPLQPQAHQEQQVYITSSNERRGARERLSVLAEGRGRPAGVLALEPPASPYPIRRLRRR